MITEHNVMPKMSDKEANKLAGKLLGEKDYNLLINYDADVLCQETGNVIAKFRKKIWN